MARVVIATIPLLSVPHVNTTGLSSGDHHTSHAPNAVDFAMYRLFGH